MLFNTSPLNAARTKFARLPHIARRHTEAMPKGGFASAVPRRHALDGGYRKRVVET